jgi:SAM-dependent methyltransferase
MTSRGAQDREKWEELYASRARADRPPSSWVLRTVARLPNELPVVDVAGGIGRHAVPLARLGRRVILVDIASQAVATVRAVEPLIDGVVADAANLPLAPGRFGVVLVTNFLDRTIFADLLHLLAPGGFLVYETYTTEHLDLVNRGVARGPTSTDYLLRRGELRELAAPLAVIEYREGEVTDEAGRRHCARLLGQKTGQRPEARSHG